MSDHYVLRCHECGFPLDQHHKTCSRVDEPTKLTDGGRDLDRTAQVAQPEREAVLEEALRRASLRFTKYAELHADKLLDNSLSEAQRQTIRGKVDRNLRYAAEARAAALTTPAPAVSRDEIAAVLTDLAEAARNACDARKHPPLTEALDDADAILSRLRGEGE